MIGKIFCIGLAFTPFIWAAFMHSTIDQDDEERRLDDLEQMKFLKDWEDRRK